MGVIPGEEQSVWGGGRGAGTPPQNPYDQSGRRNPGTRVTLAADSRYTSKTVLTRPFTFPAPPLDQIQITSGFNWSDYDTISAGQFSRPGGPALRAFSFDTLFTDDDYPWQFYNIMRERSQDKVAMAKELEAIQKAGTPIKLKIQNVEYKLDSSGTFGGIGYDFGPSPVLQMLCTLRQVSWSQKEGEPDAVYVTVGFTEHRIPGATQTKLGSGTKGGKDSRGTPALIQMKVFAGLLGPKPPQNTLQELAVAYYGSAAKWKLIKDANSWLGNITASHDLGTWDTAALKTAGKANRQLKIPVAS